MLLNEIAGNGPAQVLQDPLCGLVLDPDAELPAIEEHGTRHVFCSDGCRRAFITRQLPELR